MSTQDIAVLLTVITGSILGIWQIIVYLRNQPNLKVEVYYDQFCWTEESASRFWLPIFKIALTSYGKDNLTIERCGFQLNDGTRTTLQDAGLPKELERFQRHIISPSLEHVEKDTIRFVWADSGHKEWHSKKQPFRMN